MNGAISRTRISDQDVDELLFAWGRVIGWARTFGSKSDFGFALSVQRDRKRPGWRPSHRQFGLMLRLKNRADQQAQAPPELDLPEGGLIED